MGLCPSECSIGEQFHIDRISIRNPWKFGFDFCAVKIVTLLGQVDLRILGIIESLLAMYSVNTGIFLFLHFLKIFKKLFFKERDLAHGRTRTSTRFYLIPKSLHFLFYLALVLLCSSGGFHPCAFLNFTLVGTYSEVVS